MDQKWAESEPGKNEQVPWSANNTLIIEFKGILVKSKNVAHAISVEKVAYFYSFFKDS